MSVFIGVALGSWIESWELAATNAQTASLCEPAGPLASRVPSPLLLFGIAARSQVSVLAGRPYCALLRFGPRKSSWAAQAQLGPCTSKAEPMQAQLGPRKDVPASPRRAVSACVMTICARKALRFYALTTEAYYRRPCVTCGPHRPVSSQT